MKFEWDSAKAKADAKKHGVSFEEATTAFNDQLSLTGADPDRSIRELRFVTFGLSSLGRLVVVAHTDRSDRVRIISARLASRAEGKFYEEA